MSDLKQRSAPPGAPQHHPKPPPLPRTTPGPSHLRGMTPVQAADNIYSFGLADTRTEYLILVLPAGMRQVASMHTAVLHACIQAGRD